MSDWHFSAATWSAFGLDDEALRLCINTLRREQAKRRKEAYVARKAEQERKTLDDAVIVTDYKEGGSKTLGTYPDDKPSTTEEDRP